MRYNREEFEQCWCSLASEREGTALLLTPGADFDQIDEELENTTKRDLIFFARYLLPYKGQFMQLLLCMALGSLLLMAFPFLTQAMVDGGCRHRRPQSWFYYDCSHCPTCPIFLAVGHWFFTELDNAPHQLPHRYCAYF